MYPRPVEASEWRKSSYSSGGGQCVEVAFVANAAWRKSSHSSGGGECVEVAFADTQVALRDSKHPTGDFLTFTPTHWSTFTATLTV
jgi:hypothetical protein